MKNILVGCPYGGHDDVCLALSDLYQDVNIIRAERITQIDSKSLWIDDAILPLREIGSAFLRYPYDLLPGFSKSYSLRENTEFFKTAALLSDIVSINPLASCWRLRNRGFSLMEARRWSLNTPDFYILRGRSGIEAESSTVFAVKALGNCFVSESSAELSFEQRSFVDIEEDGGDIALVFPASALVPGEFERYIRAFGSAFIQRAIYGVMELRCYLVDQDAFVYERDKTDRFDKSFAGLCKTGYELTADTLSSLRQLCKAHGVGYLCLDIIVTASGQEWIVDVNPYGSLPPFAEFPEVAVELARLLYDRA